MPTITIDNRTYDTDTLSDEARAQLQSLQFVDAELGRLQSKSAVLQTARTAYAKTLQAALLTLLAGDTMKFNCDEPITTNKPICCRSATM
jgi:hypothetical protein